MSNDLPTSSVRAASATRSGYHKAADIALWCLAGAFLLPVLFAGALKDAVRAAFSGAETTARIWISVGFASIGLSILLLLATLALGIAALVGVRRHGAKHLLWKGLLAVMVPTLLSSLIVSAFVQARSLARQRVQSQYQTPR
ncbi:MAG: hypothetical protein Q8N18_10905 [Opitutaceae bacterium]|nr:hypothetical protein [Opitutaceae bacterium]